MIQKIKTTLLVTFVLNAVLVLSAFLTYFLLWPQNRADLAWHLSNPRESIESIRNDLTHHAPKAYIVQSGSMEPEIGVGGIVFSRQSQNYQVGDVITFMPGGDYVEQVFTKTVKTKNLVTHRITGISESDGKVYYQTKGDANEDPDTEKIKESQIVGKVVFYVPKIGYLANYAKQPYGFILLVIVPATIIAYEEAKNLFGETGKAAKGVIASFKGRGKKKEKEEFFSGYENHLEDKPSIFPEFKNTHGITKATVLIPVFGAFFVFTGLATAFFNDKEHSPQNVFQAGAWGSPTPTPGSQKMADIYNSDPYTCTSGATDTSGLIFGQVALEIISGNLVTDVTVVGGTPNSTYDIWINQDPGSCPLSSPSFSGAITTDVSGNGSVNDLTIPVTPGAINFWVSAVGGGQVLRSISVTLP